MVNYLKDQNHLIVWPVLAPESENELCTSHIGMRARYDMLASELLDECLALYKADQNKNYRFMIKRAAGDMEIPLNVTVKEAGMRNGDYLKIVAG